jgi:hypothetical protein
MNERIIFITDQNQSYTNFANVKVTHTWNDFTEIYQNELLNKKVDFQGKEFRLRDVMKMKSSDSIERIPFKTLISKQ